MADRKRILIADDDPDIAELLEAYFSTDYDITIVHNGKDALQKALGEDFDLIMLDVMMPYIDGYHVAYEISSKKENSKILIMTSRDVSSEKGIGMLSGASEVVQKPFSMEDIKQKVEALLGG